MAPSEFVTLSAATLRVENMVYILLPGCAAAPDAGAVDAQQHSRSATSSSAHSSTGSHSPEESRASTAGTGAETERSINYASIEMGARVRHDVEMPFFIDSIEESVGVEQSQRLISTIQGNGEESNGTSTSTSRGYVRMSVSMQVFSP